MARWGRGLEQCELAVLRVDFDVRVLNPVQRGDEEIIHRKSGWLHAIMTWVGRDGRHVIAWQRPPRLEARGSREEVGTSQAGQDR